ncbi:MAG: TolC family protein [Campylobacterales bacterium]
MTTEVPVMVGPTGGLIYQSVESRLPMGGQTQWEGEISYSYPLFTGFRLEGLKRWKGLEVLKKRLEQENTRRQLILNVTKLYTFLYQLKAQLKGLKKGLEALKKGVEEGEGFYREGLIDRASLESLKGKYWEVKGRIGRLKGEYRRGLEILSGLVRERVKGVEGLPELPSIEPRLERRPDIRALKVALSIGEAQIQMAEGEGYPQIGLKVWGKRVSEKIGLGESRYFNSDRSGVGVEINWPLFTGGEIEGKVEEAKIGQLERGHLYRGYLEEAKRELEADLAQIRGLKRELAGALREVEARRVRLAEVEGKFREQLVTGRVLAEAIGKLAEAEGRVGAIQGALLFWQVKGLLDSGSWEGNRKK